MEKIEGITIIKERSIISSIILSFKWSAPLAFIVALFLAIPIIRDPAVQSHVKHEWLGYIFIVFFGTTAIEVLLYIFTIPFILLIKLFSRLTKSYRLQYEFMIIENVRNHIFDSSKSLLKDTTISSVKIATYPCIIRKFKPNWLPDDRHANKEAATFYYPNYYGVGFFSDTDEMLHFASFSISKSCDYAVFEVSIKDTHIPPMYEYFDVEQFMRDIEIIKKNNPHIQIHNSDGIEIENKNIITVMRDKNFEENVDMFRKFLKYY